MQRFETGDRVRVDIPDEDDPDFDRLHGRFGTVVEVWRDDADEATGDERDRYLYQVELTDGGAASLRWRNLRPAAVE
jgi:ribosomal protein L21E